MTEPSASSQLALSQALRTTTAAAHESAERSSFIDDLTQGRACYRAFVALAAQQLVIYRALEETLHEHYLDHPVLAPVDDRRLDRVASLEHDLSVLVGPDHDVQLADGRLPLAPATVGYATFLREHGRDGVPLYIFYPPNKAPKVLPQILTPGLVLANLDGAKG